MENLGNLKLKSNLFIGLLPTNIKSVIVSYETFGGGGISIAGIVKPGSCNVNIRYYQNYDRIPIINDEPYNEKENKLFMVKHRHPSLLFSLRFMDIPNHTFFSTLTKIMAIDTNKTNKIYAKPYLLPNVSDDGRICFGTYRIFDLRSAYNLFWNIPFNDIHTHRSEARKNDVASNLDYVRRYKNILLKRQKYRDVTKEICGNKFWSASKKADGLLITSNQELLKQIPNQYWLQSGSRPIIVALANLNGNAWSFYNKSIEFSVDIAQVATPHQQRIIKKLESTSKRKI